MPPNHSRRPTERSSARQAGNNVLGSAQYSIKGGTAHQAKSPEIVGLQPHPRGWSVVVYRVGAVVVSAGVLRRYRDFRDAVLAQRRVQLPAMSESTWLELIGAVLRRGGLSS